jgi:hypothetical protein
MRSGRDGFWNAIRGDIRTHLIKIGSWSHYRCWSANRFEMIPHLLVVHCAHVL